MFGLPAETPLDLRFTLFRTPVRVHPMFWIISALLGPHTDLRATVIWVLCVFVSILVHEFGHGLTAMAFRCQPSIVLEGMGGLCYSEAERQTFWQRLAVLICGPGAGFLLAGCVYGGYLILGYPPLSHTGEQVKGNMLLINIAWGILNLFPIWPLDGGQITGVILNRFNRRSGTRWTHIISLITAGGLAIYFFNPQDPLLTIFFALFAWLNFQTLQTLHREYTQYGVEDSADWWKR